MSDELVARIGERLAAAEVPSPFVDARWLVEDAEDLQQLEGWVRRRIAREPLQLILGSTVFRTVELWCEPGVFVPRPETEVVAGIAIAAAQEAGPAALVLEPCTGSGAIACSLVVEVPGCHVEASDVNPRAIDLATRNLRFCAAHAEGSTFEVRRGSLLKPMDAAKRGVVDVLVANPPYLPARDAREWAPEVAQHDPPEALVGGVDGIEVVRRIVREAPEWLRPGGTLVVEIDSRRGADVLEIATRAGLEDARIGEDLAGLPRFLHARRAWRT